MLGVPPKPVRFGDAGSRARCEGGRTLSWQVNRSNYKPRECAGSVIVSETKGSRPTLSVTRCVSLFTGRLALEWLSDNSVVPVGIVLLNALE
ncbi:MAG: hypothetical protein Tsb0013_22140 [Phycisphaerales bacterium]